MPQPEAEAGPGGSRGWLGGLGEWGGASGFGEEEEVLVVGEAAVDRASCGWGAAGIESGGL